MEKINHKKEKKLVAKYYFMKKINHILVLFISVVVLGGCSTVKNELIPTYNNGGYKVKIIKTESKTNPDEVIIKGTVFDVKTGRPLDYPTFLKIGCYDIYTSSKGEYSYKAKNFKYDYFFIEVTSVGYKKILTDYLDLTNKNEIQIDFYLARDDRPILECPLGTKKIVTPE